MPVLDTGIHYCGHRASTLDCRIKSGKDEYGVSV